MKLSKLHIIFKISVLIHIKFCLNDKLKKSYLILFTQILMIAAFRFSLLNVLLKK